MAPRKKRPNPKKDLKNARAITITIEASESNIQRLAAFLMFADHLQPTYEYTETPLPWEDPEDPRFQKPPELQINRNAVQNALMPLLAKYVEQHGEQKAKEMVESLGASRLSLLTDMQLLDLHNALAGEAAGE